MLAVARLRHQERTRRTLWLAVAVVCDGVIAVVVPAARLVAVRRLRVARDWRIHDGSATATGELVETGVPTRRTVAQVTRLFALVQSAAELAAADQGAVVRRVDAAALETLVSAAGLLFVAALLAQDEWFRRQVAARYVLLEATAAAFPHGRQRTWWTRIRMTQSLAPVSVIFGTAWQWFGTGLVAGWNGIRTLLPQLVCGQQLHQWRLSARTERYRQRI